MRRVTLILALASRQCCILLADRRITTTTPRQGGPPTVEYRDSDTKVFITNRSHAMGFAGWGRIGAARQRMEYWIADLFAAMDTKDWVTWPERLADGFSEVYQRNGRFEQHSFLAPGYYLDSSGTHQPEIIRISNDSFPQTFDVERRRLGPGEVACLGHSGIELDPDVQAEWIRIVNEVFSQPTIDIGRLIDSMVNAWAATADPVQPKVGNTAILSSFPRTALPLDTGTTVHLGGFNSDMFISQEVTLNLSLAKDGVRSSRFFPARISNGESSMGIEYSTNGPPGPLDCIVGDSRG